MEHKHTSVARGTHVIFVVRHSCGRWGRRGVRSAGGEICVVEIGLVVDVTGQ
jgi:hypothetical protein